MEEQSAMQPGFGDKRIKNDGEDIAMEKRLSVRSRYVVRVSLILATADDTKSDP